VNLCVCVGFILLGSKSFGAVVDESEQDVAGDGREEREYGGCQDVDGIFSNMY
jgi:hypothetical protein